MIAVTAIMEEVSCKSIQLKAGKVTFDKLYTTPELLPELKSYAKFLGPKGLMPNAKVGSLVIKEKLGSLKVSFRGCD